MLGWSDGTLNPNRARFGSLEIYDVGILFFSLSVLEYPGRRRVLVRAPGAISKVPTFGMTLAPWSLKNRFYLPNTGQLSVQHTSYTLNGKKVEVAVKQIVAGKAVEQRGAFSNPEALHLYWDIPELQGF
nr:acetoacetyl-CoA synthetase-like isoform X2 [Macaca nemestrina]